MVDSGSRLLASTDLADYPEQIARRLSPYGRRKRPRLRGLDDAGLVAFMERDMAVREPFYAQAHLVVDCDAMSDDQVVEHILRQLGLK